VPLWGSDSGKVCVMIAGSFSVQNAAERTRMNQKNKSVTASGELSFIPYSYNNRPKSHTQHLIAVFGRFQMGNLIARTRQAR
jgi:hypothetical protein